MYIFLCPIWVKKDVLILVVVDNLKGIEVNSHNSVLGVFIAISCEAGCNEEIVDNFADIFNAGEKGYMIGMAMPIKLSPNYV